MNDLLYYAGTIESLERDVIKLKSQLEVAVKCLEKYEPLCYSCFFFASQHDEKGFVDTLDELGHKSCGHPSYPAAECLAEIKGSK